MITARDYPKGDPQYSHSPRAPETVLFAPQQGQATTLVCVAVAIAASAYWLPTLTFTGVAVVRTISLVFLLM